MRSRVWTHVDWRGGSVLSALSLTAGLLSIALLVGLLVPAAAAATPSAAGERVVAPEGSLGLAGLVNQTSVQRGFDVYYRQGDGHVLAWFSLRDGNQIPLREGQHRSPKYGWRHIEASHPEANYWNIQEAILVGTVHIPLERPGIRYYDLDEGFWRNECGPLRRGQKPRHFRVIVSINDYGDGDVVGVVNAYGNL
jgi:hypothetical protein